LPYGLCLIQLVFNSFIAKYFKHEEVKYTGRTDSSYKQIQKLTPSLIQTETAKQTVGLTL